MARTGQVSRVAHHAQYLVASSDPHYACYINMAPLLSRAGDHSNLTSRYAVPPSLLLIANCHHIMTLRSMTQYILSRMRSHTSLSFNPCGVVKISKPLQFSPKLKIPFGHPVVSSALSQRWRLGFSVEVMV